MKKLIMLIVLLIAAGTARAADPNNFSIIGRAALANPSLYPGLSVDGMLGVKKGLIESVAGEIGGIVNYTGTEGDTSDDFGFGVYGMLHYTGDIAIPNPFKKIAGWMPDTVASHPFAGGGWLDNTGSFWMVGSTVFDFVEVYYRADVAQTRRNYIGIMLKIWQF